MVRLALKEITLLRQGEQDDHVARAHVPPQVLESWLAGDVEIQANIVRASGARTTAGGLADVRCKFADSVLQEASPFDDTVGSAVVRKWGLIHKPDGQVEPSYLYRTVRWSDARPLVETAKEFVRQGGLEPCRRGAAEPPTFRFHDEKTALECLRIRYGYYLSAPYFRGTPLSHARMREQNRFINEPSHLSTREDSLLAFQGRAVRLQPA